MRSTKDVGSGGQKWLAICVKCVRTTSTFKVVVLLLVVALFFTIYMMVGTVADATKYPSLVARKNPAFIARINGATEEKMKPVEKVPDVKPVVETISAKTLHVYHSNNLTEVNPQSREQYVLPTLIKSELVNTVHQPTTRGPDRPEKKMTINYVRAGIAPAPCDADKEDSELLQLPPIKFLPNFKNPCWREKLENPKEVYKTNGFAKFSSSFRKVLDKLYKIWQTRDYSQPQYRLRCLPYFFLAGQPKCGSTDLYSRLITHPEIMTAPTKEPHWWGKYRFGAIPFSDYVDIFDEAAMQIEAAVTDKGNNTTEKYHPGITGDGSVSTLWSNDGWWNYGENCGLVEPRYTSAHYIRRLLPRAKVIVILRNPTSRLYSDYLYFHHSSKTPDRFHSGVQTAIAAFKDCTEKVGLRACVYNYTVATSGQVRLRVGMYVQFIDEWLNLFPRDQILVIRLEDYTDNYLATIRQVHKFLDLRTLTSDENEEIREKPKANTRREKDRKLGGMHPETRTLLENFYRPFNQKLAQILQDRRFLWED